MRHPTPSLALFLASLMLAGCGDSGIGSIEQIDIRMQRISSGIMPQVVSGWTASVAGDVTVPIDPDTVESLTLTVDSIQALPVADGTEEDNDAAWVTINIADAPELDLMALPTESGSPVVIASGAVEAGDYGNVRLFVSGVQVVFKGPIDIGMASSLAGGIPHDVNVPSSAQSGIKTDAAFTAAADADVDLVFDPDATFLNVTATGNSQVILAPVIRATGQ